MVLKVVYLDGFLTSSNPYLDAKYGNALLAAIIARHSLG